LDTAVDDASSVIGLDSALMVEFNNFGVKLLTMVAVPTVLLLGSLNYLYGGGGLTGLQGFSMQNISDGHPWLYHFHAVVIAYVISVTRTEVFKCKERFLQRRFAWMKDMPPPRATSILVENIPEEYRSEKKLFEFFSEMHGRDSVMHISTVKHTETLDQLVAERDLLKTKKREVELQFQKDGIRPSWQTSFFGPVVDAIQHFTEELQKQEDLVTAERARIKDASGRVGGVNGHAAFVTFASRKDAAIASTTEYSANSEEWVIQLPPEPSSVRWADLQQTSTMKWLGCLLIVMLYISFSPICLAISDAAGALNVGMFQPVWDSLAPTLGLTLFLGFLPTILLLIFKNFFKLRTEAMAQYELQMSYFWFQVVFVLLLPALGTDFQAFASEVYAKPHSVLALLAAKLPKSTSFFHNYVMLQWTVACMELLRHVTLAKFIFFSKLYPEKEAKEMAEPEDQDYYGMGARSSRWTLNLLIGLVFCGLSPVVTLVILVNFLIQRLVYGYLIVFAETKKPELGGHFFVECLKGILQGMVMYTVLMTGVLIQKSSSWLPGLIGLAGILFSVVTVNHFDAWIRWEKLPFEEVVRNDAAKTPRDSASHIKYYEQPELQD